MADSTLRSNANMRATGTSHRIGKESTQKTLRMQQQQIETLKKENEDLRQKYEFESRVPPSTKPKSVQFQELQQLSQQGKTLDEKKQAIMAENEQLQTDINNLSKAVRDKRIEVRGVFSTKDSDTAVSLQIRTLENRLDQALLRYSQAVTDNKKLRETIDSMRCERVIFDGVHRKMEKSLFEKKQEMAEIIEEANVCYEERSRCDDQKKSIAEQQKENRRYFEEESQDLDQKIKQCDQLTDFFRSNAADEEEGSDDGIPTEGVQVASQEHAINQLSQEKLAAYEEALWRIKNATGIDTVDALVARYLDVEDKIVTNNNIIGDLEVQIQRLEKEERKDRETAAELQADAQKATADREKEKVDLDRQTQLTLDRTQSYSKKRDEVYSSISAIYPLVSDLFTKTECEPPEEANAEGTITQTNVVPYLGQIEQKANDLRAIYLQMYPQVLTVGNQTRSRASAVDQSMSRSISTASPDPADGAAQGDEAGAGEGEGEVVGSEGDEAAEGQQEGEEGAGETQ